MIFKNLFYFTSSHLSIQSLLGDEIIAKAVGSVQILKTCNQTARGFAHDRSDLKQTFHNDLDVQRETLTYTSFYFILISLRMNAGPRNTR